MRNHHRTDETRRTTAAGDLVKVLTATLVVAILLDLGVPAIASRLSMVLAGIGVVAGIVLVRTLLVRNAQGSEAESPEPHRASRDDRLSASLARSETLLAQSERVSTTLDAGRVADLVAEGALEVVPADVAHVWTADHRSQRVRIAAYRSRLVGPDVVPPRTELAWGAGLVGWVVEHRTDRYTPDLLDGPLADVDEWMAAAGFGAAIAAPLVVDRDVVGALVLLARASGRFDAQDVACLRRFAGSAARALRNAARHTRASRRATRLTALTRGLRALDAMSPTPDVARAVARVARGAFRAQLAVVWVADDEANILRAQGAARADSDDPARIPAVVSYGSGVVGAVFASRSPEYGPSVVDDGRDPCGRHRGHPSPAAWAAIPLVASQGAVGVLVLHFSERRVFDDEERELGRRLAREAAIVIDRGRPRPEPSEGNRSHAISTPEPAAARPAAEAVHVG